MLTFRNSIIVHVRENPSHVNNLGFEVAEDFKITSNSRKSAIPKNNKPSPLPLTRFSYRGINTRDSLLVFYMSKSLYTKKKYYECQSKFRLLNFLANRTNGKIGFFRGKLCAKTFVADSMANYVSCGDWSGIDISRNLVKNKRFSLNCSEMNYRIRSAGKMGRWERFKYL